MWFEQCRKQWSWFLGEVYRTVLAFFVIVSSLLWFLDAILEKRRASADYVALAPHILDGYEEPNEQFDDVFPDLNPKLFTVSTAPE